ncbi:MAG: acyl-CoA dehydrogenase family protein [Conexivisphaerales archaeon]
MSKNEKESSSNGKDEIREIMEKNVREFCEKKVIPIADEIDREDIIPRRLYDEMKEHGMLTLTVPQEYGGLGLNYRTYSSVIEIVSEYSAGVALSLEAHNSLAIAQVMKYGSEELKKKALEAVLKDSSTIAWALTEPRGGSDARSMATEAKRDGDEYLISGTKTFITHGYSAKLIVTFAKTDNGITAFLVDGDSPGLSRSKLEGKLGTRGPDTATLNFDRVKVPRSRVIGNEGEGFSQAIDVLNGGRIAVGAMGVGLAIACLKRCVNYSKEREAFGSKLAKFQSLRFSIAEIAAETEAAWQLVLHAADMRDNNLPHRKEAAMAKYFASQVAMKAARMAVQFLGGYGYFRGTDAERMYRDAKLLEIGEGTNEVLKMIIAKEIMD